MVGGNFNNGSNDGPCYFNCNNEWGNANYNIGLRPFLPLMHMKLGKQKSVLMHSRSESP